MNLVSQDVDKQKILKFAAYSAIIGLPSATIFLLFLGLASLLKVVFLPLAVVTAIILLLFRPSLYVSYVWWIWFLTPEVRRLIDFFTAWDPLNPVILTPFLVTCVSVLFSIANLRRLPKQYVPLLGLLWLSITYGFSIGVLRNGLFRSTYDFTEWLAPIVFMLFLMVLGDQIEAATLATVKSFCWGALLLGTYGIYQYFVLPGWDRYWLESVNIASFGVPEVGEFRVFSTLNSAGPLSFVLVVGIILLLQPKKLWHVLAVSASYLCLLLTFVRGSWVSWVAGMVVLLVLQTSRTLVLKTLTLLAIVALTYLTTAQLNQTSETIIERFTSFSDLRDDQSFGERLDLYSESFQFTIRNPFGNGFGSAGDAVQLSTDEDNSPAFFDSGILYIPYVIGIFWAFCYIGILGFFVFRGFTLKANHASKRIVLFGVLAASLTQFLFGPTNVGISGMITWSFVVILIAPDLNANASVQRKTTHKNKSSILTSGTMD